MRNIFRTVVIALGLGLSVSLAGCAPEVGSDKWCAAMKEKPKGDWSANEATEFTKNCLLK